jgi:Asp/Glu/hydantoin racemase
MTSTTPRILLIHALFESLSPIWKAFEAQWPEARLVNLLDDSLSADLARDGGLTDAMIERFLLLGRYGTGAAGNVPKAQALLFTCSAFGTAIDRVKAALPIPVLKPNEAAFEAAVESGSTIGLLVTFAAALPPLEAELQAMAQTRGKAMHVVGRVVDGALAALKSGDAERHNALIAEAATAMPALDALVLGQFSMAQAAPSVTRRLPGRRVITTPDSAVKKLKGLLAA